MVASNFKYAYFSLYTRKQRHSNSFTYVFVVSQHDWNSAISEEIAALNGNSHVYLDLEIYTRYQHFNGYSHDIGVQQLVISLD